MEQKRTYRPSPTALLNPCADSVFKRLFTDNSKEGYKVLQCFLETVLQKKVTNIVLQPNEIPIEGIRDKKPRLDLNCKIDGTEIVNIEMQNYNTKEIFEKRAEYYCAHLLNHNVTEGLSWTKIPKVFQISVLNFIREKDCPREFFYYKFRTEDNCILEDRQNIIFIELPKVKKIVEEIEKGITQIEKLTATQKWCIFMLYGSKPEYETLIKQIALTEEGIMCAVVILDKISEDERAWKQQFDEFMIETDRISMIEAATEEGLQKGLEQGLEQGLKQGIEEGIKQGTFEIAKSMLSDNLPLELISKHTGISVEELNKLK